MRRTIDDPARSRHSERAKKGTISIRKMNNPLCPCGSKKAFIKPSGMFCSKCGRKLR